MILSDANGGSCNLCPTFFMIELYILRRMVSIGRQKWLRNKEPRSPPFIESILFPYLNARILWIRLARRGRASNASFGVVDRIGVADSLHHSFWSYYGSMKKFAEVRAIHCRLKTVDKLLNNCNSCAVLFKNIVQVLLL